MGEVLNFGSFSRSPEWSAERSPAFFSPLRFLPLDIREDLEYNIEVECNPFVAEYLANKAERHMGRSLQHSIVKWFRTLQGRNPKGAPRIPPLPIHQLTFYHFYPVAGAAGIRSTEYGYT